MVRMNYCELGLSGRTTRVERVGGWVGGWVGGLTYFPSFSETPSMKMEKELSGRMMRV